MLKELRVRTDVDAAHSIGRAPEEVCSAMSYSCKNHPVEVPSDAVIRASFLEAVQDVYRTLDSAGITWQANREQRERRDNEARQRLEEDQRQAEARRKEEEASAQRDRMVRTWVCRAAAIACVGSLLLAFFSWSLGWLVLAGVSFAVNRGVMPDE